MVKFENIPHKLLRYFRISQQPKHVRDIASILLEIDDELDQDYLEKWVAYFGLTTVWQEVREQTSGQQLS